MLTPEADQRWVSAHVFTAHPLDLVVRQLLPGVLDELRRRELTDRCFFIRHWQYGPHLRLRVRLTSPDAGPEVRRALAAHAAAFFGPLPSSAPMTDREYAELAARFSALEPGSEPGTLARNDSLAFIGYLPEEAKYGRGAALHAVEECFSTCSELALQGVLADWTPAQRLAHCFALFAGSRSPNPNRSPDRSAQPALPAPPMAVEQYRRTRRTLLPVARAAQAAMAGAATAGPVADPAARWFASFRRARELAADPERLPDQLTHLACNRLGVRLDQEATLRGLAALAVAELAATEPAVTEPAGRRSADSDD